MNLKKALAEFLKEEPRRSGRLEALRFVRRYAHGTRPMTHYRLQGPAVDAVPLLLRKAGLEDNRDFKVEKSAASDRTAKLWWLNGPVAGEFLAACAVESAVGNSGLTSLEEAYFAAYSRASDDDIVAKVNDTSIGIDVAAAPARRDTGVTRLIAEQSKAIRAGIIKVLTADPEATCTLSANAKAFWRAILASCQYGEDHGEFMPSLATLEFFVRIILGRTFARAPADLVFAPMCDFHTVTRPIAKGEQVPVSHLMDAPLFETMETRGGNPMEGYFSNLAETVLKSADGHPGVLAVVNAPLTCGSPKAFNQVQAAEFAFISRSSFWDYVKWIYREAYRGLNVELTSHHSMGVHSSSIAYGNYVVPGEDEDPLAGHISRADSRFLTASAMFALVIMKQASVHPPWSRPQYSVPELSVLRGTQQTPDLGGNHVRESELAAEWFMMTHVGADPLQKKGSWYYRWTAEDRESHLRAFRSYVSDLVSNPRVIGIQCSVAGNSYLYPSIENEAATFTPMSSLVSGVIGAVKYWYGANLDVPLAGWDGQDPRGCHTEGVLVSAVYSGMWGGFSASADDSDRTAFPALHGYDLSEILDSGFRSDERLAFTRLIDRLSSGDFLDQVTAAWGSDKCSLVLETNVRADAFKDRVLADPEQAKTMVRKLQFLFVDSMVYRDQTPFKVLNGEAVEIDTNRLQGIIEALAADHVAISDILGDSPTFNVADIADKFVSVSFREDSFGRLYIVFTATGNAVELARLMYRGYCGFHPASEKVASTRWTAPDSDRTVYVSDERSYDSACEIIRKAVRNLGGPLDFDDNDSRVVPGRIRPLVSWRMIGVSLNRAPTRNWFLSADAGDYTPSRDVYMP